MIKFIVGFAILVFTGILGVYKYSELSGREEDLSLAISEALDKRDQGKDLNERIRTVRKFSVTTTDAQKFNMERMLDIGAPGMEWRFVGQPLIRGNNRSLFRYTFRISGPTTYAKSQDLLFRMNKLPGFVPYRYCFNCTQTPKNTPAELRMVQIEGYLYAYDPNTLY